MSDNPIQTRSGIPLSPCYSSWPGSASPGESLGPPGQFPFTRGIYPGMYRQRLWTMRQYSGFGTAEETNQRFHYLISQGQTGLSVAFDLPTQMGYDSDHPLAQADFGKAGVAISTLEDFEKLFEGIDLSTVSVSMTINATAAILLAFLVSVAQKRGVARGQLSGTVQNDILKEFIARGTYIFPPEPSLRLAIDVWEYTLQEMPQWHFVSLSGYHISEAGAHAVQELALTFSNALAYVESARSRGLDINALGRAISFFFVAQNDFFEEIAKFRAARRLWARLMKGLGTTDEKAMALRFHTQTAGSALTSVEPQNNIVRVAYQALAAVLGGTQSLHTNSMDEALSLPSESAAKLALRTQQILAYETGVSRVADPLGGSYYVESLTDEIERRTVSLLEEIKKMGGAIRAIEEGQIQRLLEKEAYAWQKRVERGEEVLVGVNRFVDPARVPESIPLHTSAASLEDRKAYLSAYRRNRDQGAVQKALQGLQQTAREKENAVPAILACTQAQATLGEIAGTLKKVYGSCK